jgi:hypothetical protein
MLVIDEIVDSHKQSGMEMQKHFQILSNTLIIKVWSRIRLGFDILFS